LIPRFAKHYIAKHLKDSLGPNNSLAPIGNFGENKMIPFVIFTYLVVFTCTIASTTKVACYTCCDRALGGVLMALNDWICKQP
jgi:hypothetical protein